MKKVFAFILILSTAGFPRSFSQSNQEKQEYYQVSIYHFKNEEQKRRIDVYLEKALLPALHRRQIKNIGVFTPIANDTVPDKKIIVIMPAKSIGQVTTISDDLTKDQLYQLDAKDFIDAVYNDPPYSRIEKILLYAFPQSPKLQLPKLNSPKNERIYEFRSYESPTEKLFRNKVQMFNEGGEVALFKRLNFNAIFYSEVVAGSQMPNLMYMTSFENMADRDAHWKTFSADPEWKKLSSDPIYQHNVSKADIVLMRAADYSDY